MSKIEYQKLTHNMMHSTNVCLRLMALVLILYTGPLLAQGPQEVQISIFNEAISQPTKSPIWKSGLVKHPGFSIGFNKYYHNRRKNYYFWNFTTQIFNHQFVYTGVQLYGAWNYRRALTDRVNIGFETGLGYMHRFNHMKEYKIDNGSYRQIRRAGLPGIMFTLGTQFNWYPSKFFKNGSFYVKYQLQGFYHFAGEVPVLPFTMTHFGVTYPFFKLFNRSKSDKRKRRNE